MRDPHREHRVGGAEFDPDCLVCQTEQDTGLCMNRRARRALAKPAKQGRRLDGKDSRWWGPSLPRANANSWTPRPPRDRFGD